MSAGFAQRQLQWLEDCALWLRLLLALIAGGLATAAFAPLFIVPVLFVSFPLFILLLDGAGSGWRAFAIGWAFGLGHFLTGFFWVGNALEIAGAPREAWLGLPIGLAIFTGLAALAYGILSRRLSLFGPSPVLFAVLWALVEWLRGHLFTGFPWNLAGYAWGFSDAMSQFAAVTGIYGLTFLTILAASVPVLMFGRGVGRKPVWMGPLLSGLVLAGLFTFGVLRLPADGPPALTGTVVRIVQPNIAQEDKWRPDLLDDHFIDYLTMSDAPGADKVDLFLWPEAAIPYRLDQDPARTVLIGQIAKPGAFVLTGFPRMAFGPDRTRTFHNSMIVIDGDGVARDVFDKFHLVPFGEYVPFYSLFTALGIEKLVAGAGDFTPGPGPRTIDLPGLPSVSPLICYEVIFPGAVTPGDVRPDWLFNLTNDAWYGDHSGPFQHLVISRFRSIEEGLPMVRAAGTGISAIIDSYGRVERQLGLNKRGVIDGFLPPPLPQPTLYARFGDWGFWLMLVLAFGVLVMVGRSRAVDD